MSFLKKKFEEINENDLRIWESDPLNFESGVIEYKLKFDGKNAKELLRDVIQFANGFVEGFILFGFSDNPIKIIGIDKKEIDTIKTVMNDSLTRKIEPPLSPFPQYQAVPLSNGKYILLIKIFPKDKGIYGIRLSDNINNEGYYKYEFWKRLDGSKQRMNIESIIDLILSKDDQKSPKKFLDVKLVKLGSWLIVKAVNRSNRPIIITHFRFLFPSLSYGYGIDRPTNYIEVKSKFMGEYKVTEEFHKKLIEATKDIPIFSEIVPETEGFPYTLRDGEAYKNDLFIGILKNIIEDGLKDGLNYDLSEVKCCFFTNDGKFCSETFNIESEILYLQNLPEASEIGIFSKGDLRKMRKDIRKQNSE